MTKAKFVKGPYEVNDAGLIYGQVSGDEDEAPFVADCCNNPGSGEYTEQEKSTAHLLAASWEMLNALEEILEHVEWRRRSAGETTGSNDCTHRARAAIAKAKGGAV